ncbi:hypothetical protein [Fundidesulfovibrio agrisoli]|uniref:hypothetical protein n=1 Tax=Fundidesulfovibrio agrisoli TaxID=2922717 RepID=UPI001FACC7F5|nr:hypothetical protein [Fundidesulfovibrio agrisoli]
MMHDEKEFTRLDNLLGDWFTRDIPQGASLGFEARVMAALSTARRELSVWDVLGLSAKPWFAVGLAAAALLGAVVLHGQGQDAAGYLTTALDGPLLASMMTL